MNATFDEFFIHDTGSGDFGYKQYYLYDSFFQYRLLFVKILKFTYPRKIIFDFDNNYVHFLNLDFLIQNFNLNHLLNYLHYFFSLNIK